MRAQNERHLSCNAVELLDEPDFFRRRSFDSSGKTPAKLHRGNQAKDALDQAEHGSSKPP
ncbi:hypothetical protein JEY40_15610 [Bradyrhizobium japonicum]|uniref:hypothetical protein n=1 Tax=Bradyrhizobium japonicum TaxID=375 RepID=UPI00200E9934|nr:hypothetical protein [Bradyrhizobium japonicum]UQD75851.1 hypothetical protein JEY40_15610 [Bradyrhizobium japonicum]